MTGTLKIQDPSGHKEVQWETEVEESVSAAERLFNATLADTKFTYLAFATLPDGDQVQVDSFNQDAVKILMFPQMSGG